jgi:tRNA-modifying protein YgfZ
MFMRVWFNEVGLVEVRGADRVDLLHRLSTNDLRVLKQPHQHIRTLFTTAQGRVIDWTTLLSFEDRLWVLTSKQRAKRLIDWIESYTVMEDVVCADISSAYHSWVLSGPLPEDLGQWQDESKSSYCCNKQGVCWWPDLGAYGQSYVSLMPIEEVDSQRAMFERLGILTGSHEQFEQRRLTTGVPSPDFEFSEEVNPLELRLKPMVNFDKGCYIGQEVIARMDSYDKVSRMLMGFEADRHIEIGPGDGFNFHNASVGRVTSVVRRLEQPTLGLAIVKRKFCSEIEVDLGPEVSKGSFRLKDRPFWL